MEKPQTSFLSVATGDQLDVFESRKKQINLGFAPAWAGSMLLANTILGGAGMLGIPHAFSASGYILGVAMIVFFGLCSAFACHLLAVTARRIGRAPCSFYSVSSKVVPRATWVVDGAVAINCFGGAASYLVIIGDLLPPAMASLGLYSQRWLYVLMGWVVGVVLASFKNLSALRYTAVASVFIVAWTVLIIILYYFRVGVFEPCSDASSPLPCPTKDGHAAEVLAVGSDVMKLLKGVPVFIFGFGCQQNIFSIINEVQNTTNARINGLIVVAFIVGISSFTVAALLGYLTYGDGLAADVLETFPSNPITTITRVIFAFLVMFSFPLQVHPSRNSCMALWNLISPLEQPNESDVVDGMNPINPAVTAAENRRFIIITVCLLVGSLALALSVKDLGAIMGVVGATGSTTMCYIMPGLVYFVTFRKWHVKRVFALLQLCLGCVIMPTCLVLSFM